MPVRSSTSPLRAGRRRRVAAGGSDGRRVGAIAGSTNLALAETFEGARGVPFDGVTDDVFGDMLRALQTGEVDAVVDDDVAFLWIELDIRVAFTIATRNRWGCALRSGRRPATKRALDDAIAQADLPADGQWSAVARHPL